MFYSFPALGSYQRDTGYICFPVFQEFVGHPICLTVNEPDPFQAFVFKESVN
jgi:hypothetical protein